MLPPVDPAVLERNPNFEVLYADLCTRKLNPDASSRDTKKQRAGDEMRRNLTKARTDALTTQILTTTLTTLPSKAPTLPTTLHACIDIVAAQLSGQILDDDREILTADISTFLDNADIIAAAISTHLTTTTTSLRTITSPLSPPALPALTPRATEIYHTATLSLPHALTSARLTLASTATTLLSTHRALLDHAIRALEQTQHGLLARHTRSAADVLHARATLLGLQARLHSVARPPPAEFVRALKAFRRAQGSGERALRDREALARRALGLYAREGGMGELGRRKRELMRAVGRVEGERGMVGRGR